MTKYEERESGEFLYHDHCESCGSSDALAVYDNNTATCFSCGAFVPDVDGTGEGRQATGRSRSTKKTKTDLIPIGEPSAWKSRGITEETAKKWGFTRSEWKGGETVRVFNYRDPDSKQIVAQKVRPKVKEDMRLLGPSSKEPPLFGQHLWRDHGRKIVITEGEMDAMSVSQMQGHKWPVVSIAMGAGHKKTRKELERHSQWLERFDEIILMFDMDDAGRQAVAECASVFTPGKCKVAELPLNDPNEMLEEGRGSEIIDAIWGAKEYRPDGLVSIDDLLEEIKKPVEWGIPWYIDTLTRATYGRRWGEVYGIGAGTGIGKTDFMTEQAMFDVTELGLHVGIIYLEQKPKQTGKRLAGKFGNRRFHVPDDGWTQAELENAVLSLKGRVTFYDNWGQTDWEVVKSHIRFMALSLGIKSFYLDHLTAMADTANEKESIEQIMKEMAGLANELGIIIHFVSHLSTPDGKPHEEGGRVMIRHFKGSRSIGFWSYFMFGMERDPQAEDHEEATTTAFRVLKDRYTGDSTGMVIYLGYDKETGRLYEKPDYVPKSAQKETSRNGSSFGPIRGAQDEDEDDDVPF